jgi:molecular chaperone DnaJ
VLSDDAKRQQYDTYGSAFNGGGFGGGQGGGFGGFDFSGFQQGGYQDFDLGDIFGDFFGGGRQKANRGRDISIDIELTFKESIFGAERKVNLTKTSACDRCKGNRCEPGTGTETCRTCKGKGKVQDAKSTIFGTFSTVHTCDTCKGTGSVPKQNCTQCKGAGIERRQEEVAFRIPAGIEDGEMVRMSGAGEATSGGATGDLYIKVHVKSHPVFHKEGHNIVMDLPLKLSDALLGVTVPIETIEGSIDVKIPAGVTFNEVLRVKEKGVPVDAKRRGDLLIKVKIHLPKKVSKTAAKLIEELKKEGI